MIGALLHIAALACLLAVPAVAQEADTPYAAADAWIDDRVRIFDDACMDSAPRFGRFDELAAAAGLVLDGDNWRFPPDVQVRLHEEDGNCSCIMTMAALELDRQIASIILKLHEDGAETASDPVNIGVYSGLFQRDDMLVRVALETRKFQDVDMMKAYVVGWEPCPS